MLGVQPQAGRVFDADEFKSGGPAAVILTDALWKRRFASSREIIGKTLQLNGEPVRVVGVMPASFDFTSVFAPGSRVDLFSPFPLTSRTDRMGNTSAVVGRLKAASLSKAHRPSSIFWANGLPPSITRIATSFKQH